MDRDKRWERVEKAYNALVNGDGEKSNSATVAIEESYRQELFDEFEFKKLDKFTWQRFGVCIL